MGPDGDALRSDELLAQLGWVRALAQRIVADADVTDEVLQQVCLLALQRTPPDARTGPRLRAWLATATRRLAEHAGRASARRQRRERAAARPEALPSTIDLAVQREALHSLVDAMTGLEESAYSLLVARYFEGRSVAEIAAQSGVSSDAVHQRLSRARRQLRARLQQLLDDDRSGRLRALLPLAPLTGAIESAGSVPTLGHLGGLLVAKTLGTSAAKFIVGMLILVFLLVGTWYALHQDQQGPQAVAVRGPELPSYAPDEVELPTFDAVAPVTSLVETVPARDSGSAQPKDVGPVGAVRIVVVDATDALVAGATVEALLNPMRAGGEGAPALGSWFTDDSGRCTIKPPADETWLFASKAGVGCSARTDLRRLQEQSTSQDDIVLRLLPRSRLHGLVVEPDDSPSAGTTVHFSAPGGREGRVPADVVTGVDGRFDIEVDAGALVAMRAQDGSRKGQEYRYRSKPGGDQDVVLRMPGDWTVAGIVFDRDSVPVVGAKVTLWRNMPDRDLPPEQRPKVEQNTWSEETVTGADGRFAFAVRERLAYTVIARVGVDLPTPAALAVIDAHHDHAWLELRLPDPSFIAGDVVRSDGSPAEGVSLITSTGDFVTAVRLDAPEPIDLYGGNGSATSGPGGHFRIENLHPDGVYAVRIEPSPTGHAAEVANVHAGTADLRIQLVDGPLPTSSVLFDVRSAGDGRPIDNPEIYVVWHIPVGFVQAFTKSELLPDGRKRVTGFSVGETYSAWIVAPDHAELFLPPWTAEAGEQERPVELPQPAYLDVQVSHPGGRPAAWADVRLFPAVHRFNTRGAFGRAADAEGHVSFGPLDPGAMRVHVVAAGAEVERDIVIGDGARETVQLVVP